MLRVVLEQRTLLSMAIAFIAGAAGLNAYPADRGNVYLQLIELRSPWVFHALLYGYAALWFAIWERRDGKGRNITFPARQFNVGGDRRSFSLLRYVDDPMASDRLREFLLQAYEAHEQEVHEAATS